MRCSYYIDGFNVYHAVRNFCPNLLWLDYRKFAQMTIGGKDSLTSVKYFSAWATWKPDGVIRHREYIKALRTSQVEIILGQFKNVTRKCKKCGCQYFTHEEKRTDVNIALHVVRDAVLDFYDRAIIVSADSDLIPTIGMVHELAPGKEVGIICPIGLRSHDLQHNADSYQKMSRHVLQASQFPNEIISGHDIIRKPVTWK